MQDVEINNEEPNSQRYAPIPWRRAPLQKRLAALQLVLLSLPQVPLLSGVSPCPRLEAPGGVSPCPGLEASGGVSPCPGLEAPGGWRLSLPRVPSHWCLSRRAAAAGMSGVNLVEIDGYIQHRDRPRPVAVLIY